MRKTKEVEKAGGISSSAVQARTGKTWAEWFAILDKAGAAKWGHKEIVAYLSQKHGVPDWWQQMVTVAYEQARGVREKHETPSGYQMGASKTIAVPVSTLYKAWNDKALRARWLPDPNFTVRKATPSKSMRITWVDGKTHVDVDFYAKDDRKSQVSLSHTKLANAREVARMKAYWSQALEKLKEMVEA